MVGSGESAPSLAVDLWSWAFPVIQFVLILEPEENSSPGMGVEGQEGHGSLGSGAAGRGQVRPIHRMGFTARSL